MTPDLLPMIAVALLAALLLALAAAGRRGVLLRLEREGRAQDQAHAAEVLACTLHDLHRANAHAARQARTIADQAATIDQISTAMLGLDAQLTATMIRAGEALAAAELEIEAPLPTLGFMADELVTDRNHRGVL